MCKKTKITLIITALNEGKEPLETIKSIYETTNSELFNIILFNDGSTDWVEIPKKYDIQIVHHRIRRGIQYCRNIGVNMANTQYIAFLNARMRFTKGWLEKALKYLEKEPKTLFCTTSVVLWDKTVLEIEEEINKLKKLEQTEDTKLLIADYQKYKERIKDIGDVKVIDEHKERKYGADIIEYNEKANIILNVHWRKEEKGKCYEIPSILGACYFMTKKWFNHIRGLNGLRMYGSDEEFLSLKTWALGGKVKIIKEIETGNVYHIQKNYPDMFSDIMYNKLFVAFTLLDWDKAYNLMHKFKYIKDFEKYYRIVQTMLIKNMPEIINTRIILEKLKTNDIKHLFKKED